MVWLPDAEKISKICLFVFTWSTPETIGDSNINILIPKQHGFRPGFSCETQLILCKGVQCPPIFSLSNLIAGTIGWPICCMLALRWRTVTASDHPLLILLRSNNWYLNIYILMNYHNGHQLKAILTNEDKERLVAWLLRDWLIKLNWSKRPFWILGDKVTVSVI